MRPDRTNLDDYHSVRQAFTLDVPARYNPVIDIVDTWAQKKSSDLALVSLDAHGQVLARWTVGELATEAGKAARALTGLGIGDGEEIYFVDELPKTISGKIRRSELRAQMRVT